MQALKAIVILLGVLIVVSFILLIYGFYTRMTDPEFRVMKADDATVIAPLGGHIAVPAGCTAAEMKPFNEWLLIRLSGADEACNRIIMVDIETGVEVGVFTIGPP